MSQHTLLERWPIRIHTDFLGLIYRSKKFNAFSHTCNRSCRAVTDGDSKECHQRTLQYLPTANKVDFFALKLKNKTNFRSTSIRVISKEESIRKEK